MTWELGATIAAALGVAAWQWHGQWKTRAAVPFGQPTSSRQTITLAAAAGILLAEHLAAPLVAVVAWLAGVTGFGTWLIAPATISLAFLGLVGVAGVDVGWRGLYRGPALVPALRHGPIALILPAVLVAGWPLLAQTTVDTGSAIGGVPDPVACAPGQLPGDGVAGFGPDRLVFAAAIVQVGKEMGVPERGQWIALATAMQESSLRNLNHGDRDSLGLFQQRPSQGWGTPAQVTDPAYAARKFYDGLDEVDGWERLPLWQAAQAVQRSGHPTAYAKWEDAAAEVLGAVGGATCPTTNQELT